MSERGPGTEHCSGPLCPTYTGLPYCKTSSTVFLAMVQGGSQVGPRLHVMLFLAAGPNFARATDFALSCVLNRTFQRVRPIRGAL